MAVGGYCRAGAVLVGGQAGDEDRGWRNDIFIGQVCPHFFRQGPKWAPLQVFGRRGLIWWCPSQLHLENGRER